MFVRDLSVGDVIAVTGEDQGQVHSWEHVSRSDHSTVWILNFGETSIAAPLEHLLGLGCNVASLPAWNLSSIDVPPSVAAGLLDGLFSEFPESAVAVVYPSWRHPEAPVA